MRFKGVRLDLCKLNVTNKPSILTIMQKGLANSENNLPMKCDYQRVSQANCSWCVTWTSIEYFQNTTYYVRHVKFDGNYMPMFTPEYNFTYIGKFHVNYVKTYEVRIAGSLIYDKNDPN